MDETGPLKQPHLIGLYLRNLGASVLGGGIVMGLNYLTPHEVFRSLRAFVFEGGRAVYALGIFLGIILLGGMVQYLLQRPVSRFIALRSAGDPGGYEARESAQRRILNLPFIIGGANFGMWILIPAVIATVFHTYRGITMDAVLFTFFRAVMVGLIASSVSFFLIEDYSRRRLIPTLFPEGRLARVPGILKITIMRRIRVLHLAGTVIPMVILVGTLYFISRKMDSLTLNAAAFAAEFFLFSTFVCVLFIIIALRLNFLVGRSISEPLIKMLKSVEAVRSGRFEARIEVLSNDEIGVLGDAGNDMIAGLAEREVIRDLFGKYVTPEIRDEILAGRIPLDGERRVVTVLFSDLRDFTAYVEETPPEQVIQSMRAYFTAMEKAIRRMEGLVLQYVGDEIEAVFGIPLLYENHADRAVRAALEMRRDLAQLNGARAKAGLSPLRHGIGIHTGEVLAGNTGSEDRLSFALIGDTINLASRIQDLTKTFGCDILVSDATVQRLRAVFSLEKKPSQAIKGYSRPVTVYRVLNGGS